MNVYDILNQNRAISRTVTETYIEDSYTNALQRYFMLNVTYTLRRFGGKKVSEAEMEKQIDRGDRNREGRMHGGGPPPPIH